MRSYMEYMEELYEGIDEWVSTVRKYRHDLSKHIQMLEVLTSGDKDAEEIKGYIQNQKETYDKLNAKNTVAGDDILDTLLHIKKEECERKSIYLKITVEEDSCNFMEETDKVGLLLNLLDNAIEATERLPKGNGNGINVSIFKEKDNTIISVMNHIPKGKRFSFLTQKKEPECHGIGTRIIEEIITKYRGYRETEPDEDCGLLKDKIVLQRNG